MQQIVHKYFCSSIHMAACQLGNRRPFDSFPLHCLEISKSRISPGPSGRWQQEGPLGNDGSPDRSLTGAPYWWTACYSVLTSQAGCNGRVTSPPFFFEWTCPFTPSVQNCHVSKGIESNSTDLLQTPAGANTISLNCKHFKDDDPPPKGQAKT